jgi:hypothetical protein
MVGSANLVSAPVLAEVGLGMLEGGHKYGRHNYRAIGVRTSIYYDAAMRHLTAWWEGEDIDAESGFANEETAARQAVIDELKLQAETQASPLHVRFNVRFHPVRHRPAAEHRGGHRRRRVAVVAHLSQHNVCCRHA